LLWFSLRVYPLWLVSFWLAVTTPFPLRDMQATFLFGSTCDTIYLNIYSVATS
jgi:hypothetical protein